MSYPVNEIFETVQGEAHFTGTPAVFVRLQGCDVGCPWCDTKHTWPVNPTEEVPIAAMMAKDRDGQTWADMSAEQIAEAVSEFRARHVVITGGEPCNYELSPLCAALLAAGRTVQIETSGTRTVNASGSVWVTVSPKIGMPGGFKVRADAIERADEIKFPVGKPTDVDTLKGLLREHRWRPSLVWLQPLSRSEKATKLAIEAATENGWRVSIQTHHLIGVR